MNVNVHSLYEAHAEQNYELSKKKKKRVQTKTIIVLEKKKKIEKKWNKHS